MSEGPEAPRAALIALFVTSLVTAQLIAVKVLGLPLPVSAPVVGGTIVVPAGVIAYALTFFATDCYAELYGRRPAQVVVNVGFAALLVMLALVWVAIVLPASPAGVDPAAFRAVMAPSTNIVVGGLFAYVISQNWDVIAFHAIRSHTGPGLLWVRNVGSTATSQLIDTVAFVLVAFSIVPSLLGTGRPLPAAVLGQLIVGQYAIKLLIAVLDTPLVYATVALARDATPTPERPAAE